MLVVFFCVMMKILEFSSVNNVEDNNCNNIISTRNRNNVRNRPNIKRRRHARGKYLTKFIYIQSIKRILSDNSSL